VEAQLCLIDVLSTIAIKVYLKFLISKIGKSHSNEK